MRLFMVFLWLISFACSAQNVKTYIPVNAPKYIPTVISESNRLLPTLSEDYYFGSLIEVESCVGLTNKRCWSPTSQLKTSREFGAGLGQITKAYNADGSIRMDALGSLKKQYNTELKELSWDNVLQRPDLQIRAIILLSKSNYTSLGSIKDPIERLAMTDAAYNGGLNGVLNDRRACGLTKDCDPTKWFGNVEDHCTKSKKPIYGTRSACDINRTHVTQVVHVRLNKYQREFDKYRK